MSTKNRIEMLLKDLESDEESVRENSAYLLGEQAIKAKELAHNTLKDDKTLSDMNPLLDHDERVKVAKKLIKTLCDKSGWVRGNAAEALGKMEDRFAIHALKAALKDDEKIVRYSAAEALGKIKDKQASDVLIEALCDDNWSVRASAAEALKSIEEPKAITALKKALNDSHKDVQYKAADALSHLTKISQTQRTVQNKDAANTDQCMTIK